jgi:uncharacterized membrane protein YadS
MLVRWYVAPFVAVLSKSLGPIMGAKYLHQVLGLNYVVLGILAGILVVNVFKVPRWAENGVRLSRLGLKTGVILLGTLYSAAELRQLGALSVVMIGFFVLGSVGMVLWFGARRNIPNSMGGVLSAGMGVCGVSATVAAALLKKAHKAVRHTATKVAAFRTWITWLFAFGLVGLGMQITLASIKQAGRSAPGHRRYRRHDQGGPVPDRRAVVRSRDHLKRNRQ